MDKSQHIQQIFNNAVDIYIEKYDDVSNYQEGLDFFCSLLPINSSILELACGPGNVTSYLLDQRADLHFLSTDFADKMIEKARARLPMVTFITMDMKAITSLDLQFDGIVCAFGLPYLDFSEIATFFSDCRSRLRDSGFIYVSTMISSGVTAPLESPVRIHNEDLILDGLQKCGFEMLYYKIQPYHYGETSYGKDLIVVARLI